MYKTTQHNFFKAFCALVYLVCSTAVAQAQVQITSPTSFRLMATSPSNKVQFKVSVPSPVGKTITNVCIKVNGTAITAAAPTGNVYPVNWTTAAYGSYVVKAVVAYSNGSKDSTSPLTYKVIQTNMCGAMRYNATTGYMAGDTVATATDSVYRRTSWWMQGDYPTITNSNWTFIGMCNSNMYATYNCSNIPTWSSTTAYGTANTLVNYNGWVFSNNWWAQGDVPGVSAAWKQKGACISGNLLPNITSAFGADTTLVMQPITPVTINASITDADGYITGTSFSINNVPVMPTVSGNNYSFSFTPPAHGSYTLKMTATDEENGTRIVTSVIKVIASLPPVIGATSPTQGQNIDNITNIGNVSVPLSATVTDPDNALSGVTFSINNGSPFFATASGNNYSASFTPPSYGGYTLTIAATDALGTTAVKTVSFNVNNPNTQTVSFTSLPLQLKMMIGNTKTFSFNTPITSVSIRNKSLAKVVVNGNQLIVTAHRTGRTGLKITTSTGTYYTGLRVNNSNGSAPGLPPYASIGFVSEDSPSNLEFWEDMQSGLKNKNVDVRYIYIGDGPIGNCSECNTWRDTNRHINYCKNSLKYGIMPVFVYYNLASSSESFDADLRHARDTNYMKAYFNDLSSFLRQCHEVMGDDMFGIVLEPDFLGYMQQLGVVNLGTNDPFQISTCVTANGIAYNTGNINSLVTRINKTIKDRRDMGANIYYGWQMNLWSDPTTAGARGIMRTTDPGGPQGWGNLGWTAGRQNVVTGATNVTNYIVNSGILTNGADFISMDKYGLDAGAFSTNNSWWFNNDHWDNYMLYAKTVHQVSGKPVVLWQLPVGHINNSTMTSAYTGNQFVPFENYAARFEDPSGTYFFGDKFVITDPAKKAYLSQNNANDATMQVLTNDTLQWGGHINRFREAGIVHAMFGAGVGISTNGIQDYSCLTCGPTDKYWSIQKIQNYYDNEISWVDTTVFTTGILTYAANDTCTKSLKSVLGQATNMYFGYNGIPVTETGQFRPSDLKNGMNYVSFVSNVGQNANWKVQRIVKGSSTQQYKLANDAENEKLSLTASPNPAADECTVTVAGRKGTAILQLLTIDGKLMAAHEMNADSYAFDLSQVPAGIYFINYRDEAQTTSVKVVKQ